MRRERDIKDGGGKKWRVDGRDAGAG